MMEQVVCIDAHWTDLDGCPCDGPELGLIYEVTRAETAPGIDVVRVDGWGDYWWERCAFRPAGKHDNQVEFLYQKAEVE